MEILQPTVGQSKKQAKWCFLANRVTHIAALLGITLCCFAVLFVATSFIALIEPYVSVEVCGAITFAAVFLLLCTFIPLSYGLCVFEYNAVNNLRASVTDLFYAFASPQLFCRAFALFWALLWRGALVFCIPSVLGSMIPNYLNGYYPELVLNFGNGWDLGYTFLCVDTLISLIVAIAVFSRYATAAYLVIPHEEYSVSKCFAIGAYLNHGMKARYVKMTLSFLPLTLLSLLTLGVLFVLYTAPLFLLSCFTLAHMRCETAKATGITLFPHSHTL